MNIENNIKIKIESGIWVPAHYSQIEAFKKFKNIGNSSGETKYENNNGIKFTINRIGDKFHGGIYLTHENGQQYPIADWNDVKVFLLDQTPVNWYNARNYQQWAYFDFIYNNDPIRKYKTKGTSGFENHIEIPINGIPINIVFSISRNDNNTIFYERNDIRRTRIRISDNQSARTGYYWYYRRMTDDIGMIIMPTDGGCRNTTYTNGTSTNTTRCTS